MKAANTDPLNIAQCREIARGQDDCTVHTQYKEGNRWQSIAIYCSAFFKSGHNICHHKCLAMTRQKYLNRPPSMMPVNPHVTAVPGYSCQPHSTCYITITTWNNSFSNDYKRNWKFKKMSTAILPLWKYSSVQCREKNTEKSRLQTEGRETGGVDGCCLVLLLREVSLQMSISIGRLSFSHLHFHSSTAVPPRLFSKHCSVLSETLQPSPEGPVNGQ